MSQRLRKAVRNERAKLRLIGKLLDVECDDEKFLSTVALSQSHRSTRFALCCGR